MGDVDDYLASLPAGVERSELQRLDRVISGHVPAVGQATSYSMPCYTYRGVPVAAVILRRRHIAWYPFSGAVLPEVADEVSGYSHSAGTLRFVASTPLSARLVRRLLDIRMRLIDERLGDSP
jgi:uncharacterized protein YdhG (YjbR/CyaY superfamily)